MTRLAFVTKITARARLLPVGSKAFMAPHLSNRPSQAGTLDTCPYSTTQNLPHLPVPPLSETLTKFLISAKPLLKPDKFQHALQLVDKFGQPGGVGEKLQHLLERRAKETVNWLEEWWLNVAYLEYRLPVPIHVNPGILTPVLPFRGTDQQLQCAARIISYVLEYRKLIDEARLPVDMLGKNELCMKQFYRILGCCRIPGPRRDSVLVCPGGQKNSPKHVTIISNNHIFSLDVYDGDGHPLTHDQLYGQLKKIVKMSQEPVLPVGILTTDNRDKWYQAYSRMTEDETNRGSLDNVHRSIFVLCLDKSSPSGNPPADHDTVFLNQVEHGGGSQANSGNRWFDKIFQVIVSPDGYVGFNYEHSAAEGPPIIRLIDHCYPQLKRDAAAAAALIDSSADLEEPKRLKFNIDKQTETAIASSAKSFDDLIQDLDLKYYKFGEFGKNTLKKLKVSPDAFIQVAFQLAYYRIHGTVVPSYESGSLRKFRHGRTDTIRSCSSASLAYCQGMTSSKKTRSEKTDLLKAAVASHRTYTDEVVNGRGIDRHLLGLKLIALENQIEVPQLLRDEVYESTCIWKISTSQVPSQYGGLLCFGPVVSDGYGICYNPMDDHLIFAISSWRSCAETDVHKFSAFLQQSLCDGRTALLEQSPASKL